MRKPCELSPSRIYEEIYRIYIRQKGLKSLTDFDRDSNIPKEIEIYISQSDPVDLIDFIDFVFNYIDKYLRKQTFMRYYDPCGAFYSLH